MVGDERLARALEAHPYPLLFVTISGAHLYGFPSEDSDYDLRGVHILPAVDILGLDEPRDTYEVSRERDGIQLDLVTHDAGKFFGMLLKRNGYVLEQVLSPLVLHTTPEHEELKALARRCVTRHHAHHYLGFARGQWKLFAKDSAPQAKPLLYVYRVLLTGIHLMRTGEVEANLVRLNEGFGLPAIPELIRRKIEGGEKAALGSGDAAFHEAEYERLTTELETARDETHLPDKAPLKGGLSDLLVSLRLATIGERR